MPPKYESDDTTQLTSDLVILDHDTSDNENEGGTAKPNGNANGHADGTNGNTSAQTKDEVGVGQCVCACVVRVCVCARVRVCACARVRMFERVNSCVRGVCVSTHPLLCPSRTHPHTFTPTHSNTSAHPH